MVKYNATKETLDKVKALQGKYPFVGPNGEKADRLYILRVNPYDGDHLDEGDAASLWADSDTPLAQYRGEEGLQKLLSEWHPTDN